MGGRIEVGAYEAKTRLAALLDEVEKGRSVTITRHGEPVAVMMPVSKPALPAVSEVATSLRAFRRGRKLGIGLREAIEEGRR